MGFLDRFKREKTDKKNSQILESLESLFLKLFPEGQKDHDRQLNELYSHYGSKYGYQEIDSNLIFILTNYLSGTKIQEEVVSNVLSRPKNRMLREDIVFLVKYALSNHPKLNSLLITETIQEGLVEDGVDTDTIPGCTGQFGYSPSNPIPTKGINGIYDYLSRLYDTEGSLVEPTRTGCIAENISAHPIDEFIVRTTFGTLTLYFSGYHKRTSQLSPSGLILVDEKNIIISGDNDFPIGYKMTFETKEMPKLYGLRIFTCCSDEELQNVDRTFISGESVNREAIRLYNNGNIQESLLQFEHAISLNSLNAVNNKFTVLHSEKRFQEAFKYLSSLVETPLETAQGLYNLAVLLLSADCNTNYQIHKDIHTARLLLSKTISLPSDNREELREQVREQSIKVLSSLE